MLWPRADDPVHQGRLVIPKPLKASSKDEQGDLREAVDLPAL
jgi:hypothetical protein